MKYNPKNNIKATPALWQKGGPSPNPAGRPKGSRNKATLMAQALLEDEAEQMARMAISLARDGDIRAVKCVLDKLLPGAKSLAVQMELPPIRSLQDAKEATTQVMDAVSRGELALQEAKELIGLIQESAKVFSCQEEE